MELAWNALDLMPRGLALPGIQLQSAGAGQPPLRAVHDRGHHLQVAQQFGAGRDRDFRLCLPLGFEKQFGLVQNALANRGRAWAPGGIQQTGLARIAVMMGEDRRHPLAILQALPRHRHQELQGHLRRNLARAHLLLDRFR